LGAREALGLEPGAEVGVHVLLKLLHRGLAEDAIDAAGL
jgi:hypothetical protein